MLRFVTRIVLLRGLKAGAHDEPGATILRLLNVSSCFEILNSVVEARRMVHSLWNNQRTCSSCRFQMRRFNWPKFRSEGQH